VTGEARQLLDEVKERFKEHKDIVGKAFPSIECMRCGFTDFDILPNAKGPSNLNVVTIVCQRCGLIEQHMIGILRQALRENKVPIPLGKRREK
jgi:predicted nucleic-acid-binding Zn-ribbon protein